MKKIILLIVVFLFTGCYCKTRSFEMAEKEIKIIENWYFTSKVFDLEKCSKTDYCFTAFIVSIDQINVLQDSLKNIAVHCDSIELNVNGRKFKRVNDNQEFKYAKKYRAIDNRTHFSDFLEIVNMDTVKNQSEWPLIPRSVKSVLMTAYVSFQYPEDGRIVSKKIEVNLHEKNEINWIRWWIFFN